MYLAHSVSLYSFLATLRILGKKFPQITKGIEIERSPAVTNVSYGTLKLSMTFASYRNWKPMMLWAFMPPNLQGISLFLLTKT